MIRPTVLLDTIYINTQYLGWVLNGSKIIACLVLKVDCDFNNIALCTCYVLITPYVMYNTFSD